MVAESQPEVGNDSTGTADASGGTERVEIPSLDDAIPVIRIEPTESPESISDKLGSFISGIRGRVEGDSSSTDNSGTGKRRGRPKGSTNKASFSFQEKNETSSSVNLAGIVKRNLALGFHQAAKLYQPVFNAFNAPNPWELDKDELEVLAYFGTQGAKKIMPDGDIPWTVVAIGGGLCLFAITVPRLVVTMQLINLQKKIVENQQKQNVNFQGPQPSTNGVHPEPQTETQQNESTWSPKDELTTGIGFGPY